MEDGGVFVFRKEKTKKERTKKLEDGFVENYDNNKESNNLEEEIEMESIGEEEEEEEEEKKKKKKKKKKKAGKSGHKESPSSSLGDHCKIAKNEDNHFEDEEEEIEMESRNDETKKKNKKKKNINHKEGTSSSSQEILKRAKKELLDDDIIEMESGDNDEKKNMKEKVIEGVEVDKETESAGDKESIDNKKKKKRKKTEGSVNDTSGGESNKSVNLEEKRKKKKKKRHIEEVEANEKTESARDTESIDNEELKNSRKSKKTEGSVNDTSGSESNESVNLEETQTETSNGEKKRMKRKKKKDTDEFEVNEKTKSKDSIDSKKKRKRTEGTINDTSESENKRRKKRDNANTGVKDTVDKNVSNLEKKKSAVKSKTKEKEKSRRVRFSGDVEVVPPSDDSDVEVYSDVEEYDEGNLVRGKRFSPAEDRLIREAVQNYIDINQLGEEGLEMVLYSSKYPQVKGCWKEICAAIPWRPYLAVYGRARTILQMGEKRGFSEEEREIIRKFRAKHGPEWVKLAKILGKPRMHIKDAWRRFRLPNVKAGKWSQDEYQALFDLVNLDLRIKSFEERKNQNVMFRENIAWEAISEKISTRSMSSCCHKWYDQLTSPLVRQGEWADTDDYQLIDALQKQDACDVEEVDWDHLLENRSGEICRKRWDEMVRYIGGNMERSFIEQVDVLSKRYCIDMLQYRKSKEMEEEKEELIYGI